MTQYSKNVFTRGITTFVLFAILTTVSQAIATETFECPGVINGKDKVSLTLAFEDLDAVKATLVADDYFVDLDRTNKKFKIYGNYDYDGYGGSVEIRVPAKLEITGPKATKEFNVTFRQEIYSENGHVGTDYFRGKCSRQK